MTAVTDASGIATFGLDAGTWTRSLSVAGYQFTPDTIVVTTAANFNALMTSTFVASPPSDGSKCTVYGYIRSQHTAQLLGGVTVTAERIPSSIGYVGGFLVGKFNTTTTGTGGSLGLFQLELYRNDAITPAGSKWRITCKPAGIDVTVTLTASTFNLSTIVPA